MVPIGSVGSDKSGGGVARVFFKGCFETSISHPDLAHFVGPRPSIASGNGFEALQVCAKKCQHMRFQFLAMNQDGCWCDSQYGTLGSFKQVADDECVHGGYAHNACGVGPCGGSQVRNAIFAVQPLPGGSLTSMDASAGNFISRTRAHLSVGFSGEWRFAATSKAFRWSLSVVDATSKHVVSIRVGFSRTHNLTLTAQLSPGFYHVVLSGAHGNKHISTEEESGDALWFQQKSHCNVTTWQPFTASTARGCQMPKPVKNTLAVSGEGDDDTPDPPILDASANLTEGAGAPLVAVVDGNRAKDMEEDPDDPEAKKTRKYPEHDGAFISLKIGGVDTSSISGMMSAKDAIMDNYIIIQGRIVILGFSVEMDLSIIPGKMEDGGGIYFSFVFKWTLGGIPLMEIGGFLDLIPLDIDGLLGISIFETILDMWGSKSVEVYPKLFERKRPV